MATLYDYVAGLTVGGQPVVWSHVPLSNAQVQAAGRRPYLYITERTESTFKPLYGDADIIQAFVNAHIYQPPTSKGDIPDRSQAMELYFKLYDAPKHMDTWIYGQPLIDTFRDIAQPPTVDEESHGLHGYIRFRLLFPRG
jgi:hypothetical protein